MRNHQSTGVPFLFLLVAVALVGGCRSIDAPTAQVIPQVQAEAAELQSATVHYQAPLTPPPDQVRETPASEVRDTEPVLTLAVQYPHPNGDRELALAEAVIAVETPAESGTAAKIVGILRDALPGVALDEGVIQAKALDIPVAELKAILAPPGMPAPVDAPAKQSGTPASLSASVNGQPYTVPAAAAGELDELAKKVCQEGRLISYRQP